MRFLPVNQHSVLIELASLDETLALHDALQADPLPGIVEMVPAARTLLVRCSRAELRLPLVQAIAQLRFGRRAACTQPQVMIPLRYNGEDLPAVAEFYGSSVQDLIRSHQQVLWKVAFIGFAPGFAYLVSDQQAGDKPRSDAVNMQGQQSDTQAGIQAGIQGWRTPRRDTPRIRIPPGSVALAGEFSGIYPQASPGGWQLIGQTSCRMWDPARAQPALLQPGMAVQFIDESGAGRVISLPDQHLSGGISTEKGSAKPVVLANEASAEAILLQTSLLQTSSSSDLSPGDAPQQDVSSDHLFPDTISPDNSIPPDSIPSDAIPPDAIPPDNMAMATSASQPTTQSSAEVLFTVLNPGLQASWQDGGRPGCAAMGLVTGGAMDKMAWRDANWLVGNPPATPCLEIIPGGFHIRAQRDMVLAITGAPCRITLLTASQQSYNVTFATPFSVTAGDDIITDVPVSGVRSYLAIRGGADVARFLGSAAWDCLAVAGAPPLRPGEVIRAASGLALTAVQPGLLAVPALPAKGDTVTLDIIAGPRSDWFSEQALQTLTGQPWQVTAASNRIGLRLAGLRPLLRSQCQELPSEGICSGAIQVPASGQPVLFLRDHPLTGGYPVIATVADHHLDLAGQIPPAGWLRFNLIVPFQEITGDLY